MSRCPGPHLLSCGVCGGTDPGLRARAEAAERERDEARRQAAALTEGLRLVSDALARLNQIYRSDIDLGDPPVETPAWLQEAQHRAAALLAPTTPTPALTDAARAALAGEGEPTPHFPNEHGDCPSWCVGCQHDPPQQCFFPRCRCASPSLGDCKGQQSAPEMEEAAKLRVDNERLRVALERLYKQAAAHWASMSMAVELDAARLVLAGEQLPDAATEARSDWHHGYPAGALLRLVAYALRECGYALCRALADDIERFAEDLHPSGYDSAVELSGALLVMLRQLGGLTVRADYLLSGLAAKQPDWIEPLKRRKKWLTSALAGAEEGTSEKAREP